MNRRGFFRAFGLGAASVVAAPYLPALMKAFPAPAPSIPLRKIMARIRITQEMLNESTNMRFSALLAQPLITSIIVNEEAAILGR